MTHDSQSQLLVISVVKDRDYDACASMQSQIPTHSCWTIWRHEVWLWIVINGLVAWMQIVDWLHVFSWTGPFVLGDSCLVFSCAVLHVR